MYNKIINKFHNLQLNTNKSIQELKWEYLIDFKDFKYVHLLSDFFNEDDCIIYKDKNKFILCWWLIEWIENIYKIIPKFNYIRDYYINKDSLYHGVSSLWNNLFFYHFDKLVWYVDKLQNILITNNEELLEIESILKNSKLEEKRQNISSLFNKELLIKIGLFNTSNYNLSKIYNILMEVYDKLISPSELFEWLNESLNNIINYNNYYFEDKYNWKEFHILDILININSKWEWKIFTYRDNQELRKELSKYNIYNNLDKKKLNSFDKDLLTIELWKFSINNLFLNIIRSLWVNNKWEIVSFFNLRFYNTFEIKNNNYYIWNNIENSLNNYKSFFVEKVDWQLITMYFKWWDLFLQSKNVTISLNTLFNNKSNNNLWILYELYIFLKENNINKDIFYKSFSPWKIYLFEFVRNNSPIVQEYNDNDIGLYLIWIRDKYTLMSLLDLTNYLNYNQEIKFYTYLLNKKNNTNIFKDILITNTQELLEELIINKRWGWDNDYVFEWIIKITGWFYQKIKLTNYFIEKLLKWFSINKINNLYLSLSHFINKNKKTILNDLFFIENFKNKDFFTLKKEINNLYNFNNKKLEDSILRYIIYLINNNININDIDEIYYFYKNFIIESFIDWIINKLMSDTEEMASLENILWIEYSDDIQDKIKEYIFKEINNINTWKHEKRKLFLQMSNVINDILILDIGNK